MGKYHVYQQSFLQGIYRKGNVLSNCTSRMGIIFVEELLSSFESQGFESCLDDDNEALLRKGDDWVEVRLNRA